MYPVSLTLTPTIVTVSLLRLLNKMGGEVKHCHTLFTFIFGTP